MTFYVSLRYFPLDGRAYSPKEYLAKCFKGLSFEARQICFATSGVEDGRILYEIELDSMYTDESSPSKSEVRDVLMEALASFGAHLKSQASAIALAQLLTNKTWEADGSEKIKLQIS